MLKISLKMEICGGKKDKQIYINKVLNHLTALKIIAPT